MSEFSTPVRTRVKRARSPVSIPPSPFLKKLGYGTGVGVYKLERSPQANKVRSPWAIKKLLKQSANNAELKKRLYDEAEVLGKLNHPNIVGFRGFIKSHKNESCLAMEKCNVSLGDMIEERREHGLSAFPAMNLMRVAKDIAEALHYLHTEVLLLHCDVKSFNVLINGNFDVCKLCDFGVTLPLTPSGEVDYLRTGEDVDYLGTRLWSPPEVFKYPCIITTKADLYSYGLTLWEMLALQPPCLDILDESDTSLEEIDEESLVGKRPDLPDIDFDASYKYALEIFHCCTEFDYHERPSALDLTISIPEMIKEMDSIVN
ncbi:hypothetical protein PPYR_11263 [Photinus pyralis]|uniref:Protein kinase domain-containing protein n=1 Tax=Photinus pyralis TaxID=7054 RepID=A0A1Y1KVP1_PHOPY|nr:lymphokine-activated killer T-cell-originated protein kinase homolog [Photinus pyralis]KAB0794424.1 hypothetical protein PPYR_11263 [Photinus pyralis]